MAWDLKKKEGDVRVIMGGALIQLRDILERRVKQS
jgi:hypothetical protein